jgi:hypothetical protein
MNFVPQEKATPIRYPSVANLMLDSADRNVANFPLANDFRIEKTNSLLNGFFTRIGATEVVFEWTTPNISVAQGNQSVSYTVTVGENPPFESNFVVPDGFYTVANLLNFLFGAEGILNQDTPSTGLTWDVAPSPNASANAIISVTSANADPTEVILSGDVIEAIFGQANAPNGELTVTLSALGISSIDAQFAIDLRPARYIDIVCNQLTNNQSVKDASTSTNVRDVLVRWYFDYDTPNQLDEYGYPILMGYTPFYLRRIYNPPKQIQWATNIPVGNLALQLYNDFGELAQVVPTTDYLLTLQASEV